MAKATFWSGRLPTASALSTLTRLSLARCTCKAAAWLSAKEFIAPTEKGIREAAESGIVGGYPVTDIAVSLFDGSSHDVDSNEMAFKTAGSMAFKEGMAKGGAVLQEPIMDVEVVVPEEFMGDVLGDLSSRRGGVEGMEQRQNTQAIRAKVPLAEMFGYATELRSMTQGRGVYTMEFHHYQQLPQNLAEEALKGNAGGAKGRR